MCKSDDVMVDDILTCRWSMRRLGANASIYRIIILDDDVMTVDEQAEAWTGPSLACLLPPASVSKIRIRTAQRETQH
jgi:hypothetical protein